MSNILQNVLNSSILEELTELRSNSRTIYQKLSSHSVKHGGTNKEIIERATAKINNVINPTGLQQIPDTNKDLEIVKEKVKNLSDHIDKVASSIEDINSTSISKLDSIYQAKTEYEKFLKVIEGNIMSKDYRTINDHQLRMIMAMNSEPMTEELKRMWSTIYNIWLPFVTNIKQITDSLDKDANIVHNILGEQSEQNIRIIDDFEKILDVILEKLHDMTQLPKPHNYVKISQMQNIIKYKMTDINGELINDGSIVFSNEKIYNYMRDIDLTKIDSLRLIETTKMKFIDNYVDNVVKGVSFMDALGIDVRSQKNINNTKLLEQFKSFELLKNLRRPSRSKEQTGDVYSGVSTAINTFEKNKPKKVANVVTIHKGGNGEFIKPLDSTGTMNTASSILDLTDKIKRINIKLNQMKEEVKQCIIEHKKVQNYVFYVMSVASLKGIKRLNIYKYVNRGILDFYRNIIDDISSRISQSHENPVADAIYFNMYHGILIDKMKQFLVFLIKNMTIDELIEINDCTGPIVSDFVLFNHFKDILDSYYETIQNNVSIYARINDFSSPALPKFDDRLIVKDKDPEKSRNIVVNYKKCLTTTKKYSSETMESMEKAQPLSIKFNMVFDYDEFVKNENIAMYMSIGTNISKKKSVMLVTYGYSGTGKTYTLFGNGEDKGLIQSAIEGILSKKEIYFRTYEIYGAGVKYPFYWCDSVTESCYVYNIDPVSHEVKKNAIETDIDTIIKNSSIINSLGGYMKIEADKVKIFFRRFNKIVDEIDEIRKKYGRIKETPNNPVSSRSIIIYDVMIRVDDDLVRLVVVDLPGREEIVQTYTNNYIEKNPTFDTPYHKAVLSSMSIDPLYLAILCPALVVKGFNNLDKKTKQFIIESELEMNESSNCLDKRNACIKPKSKVKKNPLIYQPGPRQGDTTENYTVPIPIVQTGSSMVSFLDENVITTKDGTKKKMREFINTNELYDIVMIKNDHYVSDSQDISDRNAILINFAKSKWKNDDHIDNSKTTVQYQAVIVIHLLNRILLLKDAQIDKVTKYSKFKVLEKIYTTISERYGYLGYEKITSAPFEGVYINENIVGLLKVLGTDENMLNKSKEEVMRLISIQKSISFLEMKDAVRSDNVILYYDKEDPKTEDRRKIRRYDVSPKLKPFEKLMIDETVLNKIYIQNRDGYSSQKIFLFCNPLIERVAKFYINDTNFTDDTNVSRFVPGTRDVKIFYLFSNVNQDLKCVHQYKLFENTLGLMKLIDSANV